MCETGAREMMRLAKGGGPIRKTMNQRADARSIWGGGAEISLHPPEAGNTPPLDAAQLEVLRKYGAEDDVSAGDVLYADGDDNQDLIVVLDGDVEIIEKHGQPGERIIVTFGPLEVLGEMRLLTGQRAYATAVMRRGGRVLRIPVERLRVIMAQELELSEFLLRTFLVRHAFLTRLGAGLTLIGSRFDADTRRLLEVLARNRLSSKWLDLERSPEAEAMLCNLYVPVADLPIIVVPGGSLLRNPSSHALLEALGMSGTSEHTPSGVCDLLVVGGGPGGLAAAVYGASEGMATTLAEDTGLGGQAGTSSRIENYLGFPAGLSGEELAARATLQAEKFGARMKLASRAVSLSSAGGLHQVTFDDGEVVTARSVIIATGARYNRLPLYRFAEFEGVGVYYAATQMEAQACGSGPVVIVGGGNSAGQAALFLSRGCPQVHVVIRGSGLQSSMSRYLVDEIERCPNIVIMSHTQVTALLGGDQLEAVELTDSAQQQTSTLPVRGLFIFIGAKPSTEWLAGQLAEDKDGFLLTGKDVPMSQLDDGGWTPLFLETSRRGIFCVGDVRSGSVKRVATAIGEGSMAVRLVFERLQST
jgi:thioredoxin reductase (NADPH)